MIQSIMCGVQYYLQETWALVKADTTLHMFCKKPNMTNNQYKTQLEAYITVLESYWGCVPIHPDLLIVKLKSTKVTNV